MRPISALVSLGALVLAMQGAVAQIPDPAQPAVIAPAVRPAPAAPVRPAATPVVNTIPQTPVAPSVVAPAPANPRQLVTPPPAPMPVAATDCTPSSTALGTTRTMVVEKDSGHLGHMSYPKTLALRPGEVVLTFDDGPIPRYTPMVLDALRAHCVKATFFIVGRMAKTHPELLKRIVADGHTIATHTYSHVFSNLPKVKIETLTREVLGGIAAVRDVLGPQAKIAPFFRHPGLNHSAATDAFLTRHGLISMSADMPVDDWLKRTPEQVKQIALERLAAKGSGIILLHDIQERTARMLPEFLTELKARGYKVVNVVPEQYLPAVVPLAPGDPAIADLQSAPPPPGSRPRKARRPKADPAVAATATPGQPKAAPTAPAKPLAKPASARPKPPVTAVKAGPAAKPKAAAPTQLSPVPAAKPKTAERL